MKIYLDTSSLIKLYFFEQGTEELDKLFRKNQINEIFLSEISKIEFSYAIWKKIRTRELDKEDALELIDGFNSDYAKYTFIEVTHEIIEKSAELILKYGSKGLRTLDSIHLASIIKVKEEIEIGKSADKLLEEFFNNERIKYE